MVLERSLLSPNNPSSQRSDRLLDAPEHLFSSLPTATCDVAIVGAGIVGLTLACALKASGLSVMLIDANPKEAGLHQRRAYAITLMSGRILNGLGVWSRILPQITTFRTIRLADSTWPTVVNLKPRDLGTDELGYVAEHCVLVQELQRQLTDMAELTWWDSAEMTGMQTMGNDVRLSVQKGGQFCSIRARLVVAADGGRSPLRHQNQIRTNGWNYWQSCVTAVIRPEKDHGNIAREHFWPSGPFATLPLPGNRCQIVLTAPHKEAQHYMDISDEEFLALLDRRYGHQLGQLQLLTPRRQFPVRLMQSRTYVQHRLALVGDAAHCCHPVGGQGMNLGIRDAAVLAEVITEAHRRGKDIGSISVLKRYGRWRWWENLVILGFTDVLDRSFSNKWGPVQALRRLGLWMMQRVGLLKRLALLLMTGGLGRSPQLAQQGSRMGATRLHDSPKVDIRKGKGT
ncbi:MAG: FAD-dependent hydroxylase [Cyanobacteria bacterium P01_F01_bin.150]